jgi:hypothetical protein
MIPFSQAAMFTTSLSELASHQQWETFGETIVIQPDLLLHNLILPNSSPEPPGFLTSHTSEPMSVEEQTDYFHCELMTSPLSRGR